MPLARPGGVTFACILSIVLGILGIIAGATLFLVASALTALFGTLFGPLIGAIPFAAGTVLGGIPLGLGILGVVAGSQGLKGAEWARWTMVVLFAIGAVTMLPAFVSVLPLAIVVLNIFAIVYLVNAQASEWFARIPSPVPILRS
ncbi:MAG: hypothetical protein ACYDDF_11925 [Thermoplasmatota archaeon]